MPAAFLNTWIENRRRKKAKKNTIHAPEIGWTIQVPVIFSLFSEKENKISRVRTERMLEKLDKLHLINQASRTLFFAQYDRFNIIASSISPLVEMSEFEKHRNDRDSKELFLQRIQSSLPHVSLDHHREMTSIGGKEFEDFQVSIQVGDRILFKAHMFSAAVKDHNLGISVIYQNSVIGDKILHALNTSVFS